MVETAHESTEYGTAEWGHENQDTSQDMKLLHCLLPEFNRMVHIDAKKKLVKKGRRGCTYK